MDKRENFSKNLRFLCDYHKSIAQVCRELRINQQQFSRYVNGVSLPSGNNLQKICLFFKVNSEDIFLEHPSFREKLEPQKFTKQDDRNTDVFGSLTSTPREMNEFLGQYHTHYLTPSLENKIIRSFTTIFKSDGSFHAHSIDFVQTASKRKTQAIRSYGRVTFIEGKVFITDKEEGPRGCISQTILTPSFREKNLFLRGVTIGVSSNLTPTTYASRIIFSKISNTRSVISAVRQCGAFKIGDKRLRREVSEYLGQSEIIS